MNRAELKEQIELRWPGQAQCGFDPSNSTAEVTCARAVLADLCRRIFQEWGFAFAGLIVEEGVNEWQLRYAFYAESEAGWVHVLVSAPLAENAFPSIVEWIHAADWHEREAEDMFGVHFEGHPRLGDFVLHNDAWQENVEPMRRRFDAQAAMRHRRPDTDWRPLRIVEEAGAFVMPIGPKFSGVTESVHFLLESVGEDVIRSSTRLFYKWRAIEKLAEGKTVIPEEYIFEPSPARVFEELLPRWTLAKFQLLMLEAFTSEHSARMIAMKNATDNAETLIGELTTQRNKIRQASITKEISEIVGTAEALK